MAIRVSGEPGRPITFAAAPGARVVIKGSEMITGRWSRISADATRPEPFPNAFQHVWQIRLNDRYFCQPENPAALLPAEQRHISSVYVNDRTPLQMIGPSPFYDNRQFIALHPVGRGVEDLLFNSFYFDRSTQTLFVKISGEPS